MKGTKCQAESPKGVKILTCATLRGLSSLYCQIMGVAIYHY